MGFSIRRNVKIAAEMFLLARPFVFLLWTRAESIAIEMPFHLSSLHEIATLCFPEVPKYIVSSRHQKRRGRPPKWCFEEMA